MLKKRIIPCLDIHNGRTVKGTNFVALRDAGNPVELAERYCAEGADELVFLDISATVEERKTLLSLVQEVARTVSIPFTVGGGISSPEDALALLGAGADKVSLNSAAVKNPSLISAIAAECGSQCVVVAIDTRLQQNDWEVVIHGGRTPVGMSAVTWAQQVVELGAGELLLTSMNNDGTKQGFALDITNHIATCCSVPVIASGGAGSMQHFSDLFLSTKASAGLAASIFHYGEISIPELKTYLRTCSIPIR